MKPKGLDDKYEVVKTLHKTAATAVMLVRHKQIGDVRVLKVIQKDHPEAFSILSEANLLSGIKSPGIPTIYDVGQSDDCNYLVEEYIRGQSLNEMLLEEDEMSKAEILRISIEICKLIKQLHEFENDPIIYRDMKPEHIILTEDKVYLIDFGISVKKSDRVKVNSYGSKGFAAPEQLKGIEFDERCDIYGVGKVIEKMLLKCPAKDTRRIKALVDEATADDLKKRYKKIDDLLKKLLELRDESSYEKLEIKHLNRKIAIIGNSSSVGCTHIAVKLTQYFNKEGRDAYYVDINSGSNVKCMARNLRSQNTKDGVLYHKYFRGIMDYGPAIERFTPPNGIKVVDYGSYKSYNADADIIFYVVSARPWMFNPVTPEWINDDNVYVILNQSVGLNAVMLAKHYGKKVYRYPYNDNVFAISKKEQQLFEAITRDKDFDKN